MAILRCLFIVLYCTADFCLSVGVKTLVELFGVEDALLQECSHLVQPFRIPQVCRFLKVFNRFADILRHQLAFRVNMAQGIQCSGIDIFLLLGLFLINLNSCLDVLGAGESKEQLMCHSNVAIVNGNSYLLFYLDCDWFWP